MQRSSKTNLIGQHIAKMRAEIFMQLCQLYKECSQKMDLNELQFELIFISTVVNFQGNNFQVNNFQVNKAVSVDLDSYRFAVFLS